MALGKKFFEVNYSQEELETEIDQYSKRIKNGEKLDDIYEEISRIKDETQDKLSYERSLRALAFASLEYEDLTTSKDDLNHHIKQIMLEVFLSPIISSARTYSKKCGNKKALLIYTTIILYMESKFIGEEYRINSYDYNVLDLLDENKIKRYYDLEDYEAVTSNEETEIFNVSLSLANFIFYVSNNVRDLETFPIEIRETLTDFINYMLESFERENPSYIEQLSKKCNINETRFTVNSLIKLGERIEYNFSILQLRSFLNYVNRYSTYLTSGMSLDSIYEAINKAKTSHETKYIHTEALAYAYAKLKGISRSELPNTGNEIIDNSIFIMRGDSEKVLKKHKKET